MHSYARCLSRPIPELPAGELNIEGCPSSSLAVLSLDLWSCDEAQAVQITGPSSARLNAALSGYRKVCNEQV